MRPQILRQDHSAAIQRARTRAAGQDVLHSEAVASALMSFRGSSLGADPGALCMATIGKCKDIVGHELSEAATGRAIAEGQWSAELTETGEWSGRIRLRLRDHAAVKELHAGLHGTPVHLGSSWSMLVVSNVLLPTTTPAPTSGNGQGQTAGRSASAAAAR